MNLKRSVIVLINQQFIVLTNTCLNNIKGLMS